jgi:hypothetical protein
MIRGVIKTINVTSDDIQLIEFLLGNSEKAAKSIPDSDSATRDHMNKMHSNLRQTLKEAK